MQALVYVIETADAWWKFKTGLLQNIRSELEEKEMEAWQKPSQNFGRMKFMNSIAPILHLLAQFKSELESK